MGNIESVEITPKDNNIVNTYICNKINFDNDWYNCFDSSKITTFRYDLAKTLLGLISLKSSHCLGWKTESIVNYPIEVVTDISDFIRVYGFSSELQIGVSYMRRPRRYIIVVRGSLTADESINDYDRLVLYKINGKNVMVNLGSLMRFYESIHNEFLESLIDGDEIYITGFGTISAGVCILLALAIKKTVNITVYTFSNNSLGNLDFMNCIYANKNIKSFWTVITDNDKHAYKLYDGRIIHRTLYSSYEMIDTYSNILDTYIVKTLINDNDVGTLKSYLNAFNLI
jgi:hypothetical protein